jgi:hypothetical protein
MATRDEVLPVGPPVMLEYQIGRMQDIERLRLALGTHHEDVVLVDVRRTGKTTVALCAMQMLAAAGHRVFALDASDNAPATVDLADRLVRQLAAYQSGALRLGTGVARGIRSLFEHGRGALELLDDEQLRTTINALVPDAVRDRSGTRQLEHALDCIDASSADTGHRAVILIDEIQEIGRWPDSEALQDLLRSRLRRAGGNTSFLFAGSEPTSIDTLFRRGGALDFQGIEQRLEPISALAWFEGLKRAFSLLEAKIDDGAIDVILEASENHPLRTMLAARETHAMAETLVPPGHATRGVAVRAVETAKGQRLWQIENTA